MGKREYTPARAEANAKYDAKTYQQVNIRLRIKEDADIIASLEEAKRKDISTREWLREIFEGK